MYKHAKCSSLLHIFAVTLGFFLMASMQFSEAVAAPPAFNDNQRRAYLEYYAPVIFKKGNGNRNDTGRDWITNFDFDQDFVFGNNKANYENINRYVDASRRGVTGFYKNWLIRPTLYTAAIEYAQGNRKDMILFYHVYHAMDQKSGVLSFKEQIHDWERIEVRITNARGTPGGAGEFVKDVIITQHNRSLIRSHSDSELNFLTTPTGKHVLIWQAQWSAKRTNQHGQELRFVRYPLGVTNGYGDAELNINNASRKKNVHYIFVPESSSRAVRHFQAKVLSYETAHQLASRYDDGDTAPWIRVPRITYELQDIADILPTNWRFGGYPSHWTTENRQIIQIRDPLRSETGAQEVSIGRQIFYTKSRDTQNEDKRSGYPEKSWFWGVHDLFFSAADPIERIGEEITGNGATDEFFEHVYAGTARDKFGRTRGDANGLGTAANGRYWDQHDYFVHDGTVNGSRARENGFFLTRGWHLAANGGFDGRWAQLFPDRSGVERKAPLKLNVRYPRSSCQETFSMSATATGGEFPYHYTWKSAGRTIRTTQGLASNAQMRAYLESSVTIRDGNGRTITRNFFLLPTCGTPPGGITGGPGQPTGPSQLP